MSDHNDTAADHADDYTMRDFSEALRASTADRDARKQQAKVLLKLLAKAKRTRSHRRLRYTCARNCTLLEVFQFPEPMGWVFRQPRWKVAPSTNEAFSNTAGRRSHTEDGDRRWKENIVLPEEFENLNLHCDHLHAILIDQSRMLADACRAVEVTLTDADDTTRIASV